MGSEKAIIFLRWIVLILILTLYALGYYHWVLDEVLSYQVPQIASVTTPTPTPVTPDATSTPQSAVTITDPEPNIKTVREEYPVHKDITATVFWVGEPEGNGSSEDNGVSAWDDEWQKNYGGFDDPNNREGFYPKGFIPKENPFYLDLPYSDFDDKGVRKPHVYNVIPWANFKTWKKSESMMKNRWVKMTRNDVTCYGQIEDAGPYEYDDYIYVFGSASPKNTLANNAGMDVSPALRDCLKFDGVNNDTNKVDWQFIEEENVPEGPWKEIVTTSQINWK